LNLSGDMCGFFTAHPPRFGGSDSLPVLRPSANFFLHPRHLGSKVLGVSGTQPLEHCPHRALLVSLIWHPELGGAPSACASLSPPFLDHHVYHSTLCLVSTGTKDTVSRMLW
jgi:hypothetical protein